jgi:formamidopyrimidine-DNA glycosylase
MPELPEVETTRLGLAPLVIGKTIRDVLIREQRLRWPVQPSISDQLQNQSITDLSRRGKYLLISTTGGTLLLHLGMSGNLRYLTVPTHPSKHDHIDFEFSSGELLRFNDPRRFGSLHFSTKPDEHWLLKNMGPEPLGPDFTGDYLWKISRRRRVGVKSFLMNGRIVAGVGNIYANESLFRASIHPARPAGRISRKRIDKLVHEVQAVLKDAIRAGGTTLQDFVGGDGRPGYFQLSLNVYDRAGNPCARCTTPIRVRTIGQRATYYCPKCQR